MSDEFYNGAYASRGYNNDECYSGGSEPGTDVSSHGGFGAGTSRFGQNLYQSSSGPDWNTDKVNIGSFAALASRDFHKHEDEQAVGSSVTIYVRTTQSGR